MATLSIRIPDSLHKTVKELAESDHVSLNQFIAYAITEKVSSLKTVDYLKQRAEKANIEDFDKILSMVPDVEPDSNDKLN